MNNYRDIYLFIQPPTPSSFASTSITAIYRENSENTYTRYTMCVISQWWLKIPAFALRERETYKTIFPPLLWVCVSVSAPTPSLVLKLSSHIFLSHRNIGSNTACSTSKSMILNSLENEKNQKHSRREQNRFPHPQLLKLDCLI